MSSINPVRNNTPPLPNSPKQSRIGKLLKFFRSISISSLEPILSRGIRHLASSLKIEIHTSPMAPSASELEAIAEYSKKQQRTERAERIWYHGTAPLPYAVIAGLYPPGAPAATRQSFETNNPTKTQLFLFRKESGVFKQLQPINVFTPADLASFYGFGALEERVILRGHDLTNTILEGARIWFVFYAGYHNMDFTESPSRRDLAARKYASMVIDYGVHPTLLRLEVGDMLWMCDLSEEDKVNLTAVYLYLCTRDEMKMDQCWKKIDEMPDSEAEKMVETSTKLWDIGLQLLIEEVSDYWKTELEIATG